MLVSPENLGGKVDPRRDLWYPVEGSSAEQDRGEAEWRMVVTRPILMSQRIRRAKMPFYD